LYTNPPPINNVINTKHNDRVRGAIINSHFEFPMQRITINLAPADVPKEGGRFDLPIALGILAASGQDGAPKSQAHLNHYAWLRARVWLHLACESHSMCKDSST
jgi:hypothetical protein